MKEISVVGAVVTIKMTRAQLCAIQTAYSHCLLSVESPSDMDIELGNLLERAIDESKEDRSDVG